MIPIPQKDDPATEVQYQAMMNRLGPVAMKFLLDVAKAVNDLSPATVPIVLENEHAGSNPENEGHDQRLPRSKSRK